MPVTALRGKLTALVRLRQMRKGSKVSNGCRSLEDHGVVKFRDVVKGLSAADTEYVGLPAGCIAVSMVGGRLRRLFAASKKIIYE